MPNGCNLKCKTESVNYISIFWLILVIYSPDCNVCDTEKHFKHLATDNEFFDILRWKIIATIKYRILFICKLHSIAAAYTLV